MSSLFVITHHKAMGIALKAQEGKPNKLSVEDSLLIKIDQVLLTLLKLKNCAIAPQSRERLLTRLRLRNIFHKTSYFL